MSYSDDYVLIYEARTAAAKQAIEGLSRAVAHLDGAAIQSAKDLRAIGRGVALGPVIAQSDSLRRSLNLLGGTADLTKQKIRNVGTGAAGFAKAAAQATALNTSMATLAQQVGALTAALAAMQSQAAAALVPMQGIAATKVPAVPGAGTPGAGAGGRTALGLGTLGPVSLTAMAARGVTRVAGEANEGILQFMDKSAKDSIAFREAIRELVTTERGPNANVTDADMKKQLDFQAKTLMTTEEAVPFRLQFESAFPAAVQAAQAGKAPAEQAAIAKRMTALKDHIGIGLGRIASRTGMDPESTGKLAGLLPLFGGVETTDDATILMGQLSKMLTTSATTFKQGLPSALGMASSLVNKQGGKLNDLPEAFALFSALTTHPRTARTAQSARTIGINAMELLYKKDKDGKLIKALTDVGITDADSGMKRLAKIAPSLQGDRSAAETRLARGGFSIDKQMGDLFLAAQSLPIAQARLAEARANPKQTLKEMQEADRQFGGSAVGQARSSQVAAETTSIASGTKIDLAEIAIARAKADLASPTVPEGLRTGTSKRQLLDTGRGIKNLGMLSGERETEMRFALDTMRGEFKKIGRDMDKEFPMLAPEKWHQSDPFRQLGGARRIEEEMQRALEDLHKASGDPARTNDLLEVTNATLTSIDKKLGGPAARPVGNPAPKQPIAPAPARAGRK